MVQHHRLFGTSALIGAPGIPYWHFLSQLPSQYFQLNLNSVNGQCIFVSLLSSRESLLGIDFIFIVPFLSAECCAIKSVICHWAVLYCGNLFWGLGAQSGRANTFDSFIFQEIYCSHNPGKYLPIWRIYFLWHALLRNSTSSPQKPYQLAFEN